MILHRFVHDVWDFRPWDVMTKVRYFLMAQFHKLRILEVDNDLETYTKTLIYLNFDPMGVSRGQKWKIKH